MIFRAFSGLMATLSVWSASLQLNDPDPARWVAIYLAGAAVAVLTALGRRAPRAALAVATIALVWAAALVPELLGRWQPSDLTAKMVRERPEIEFGREFGGLVIVGSYCFSAYLASRRQRG